MNKHSATRSATAHHAILVPWASKAVFVTQATREFRAGRGRQGQWGRQKEQGDLEASHVAPTDLTGDVLRSLDTLEIGTGIKRIHGQGGPQPNLRRQPSVATAVPSGRRGQLCAALRSRGRGRHARRRRQWVAPLHQAGSGSTEQGRQWASTLESSQPAQQAPLLFVLCQAVKPAFWAGLLACGLTCHGSGGGT